MPKTHGQAGRQDYETPPEVFDPLNKEFGFTLDAFASHKNALCDVYCTVDGTYRKLPGGGYELTNEWDGFAPKTGHRVWANPPYRNFIGKVVDDMLKREADVYVTLLPVDTGTSWWKKLTEAADWGWDLHSWRVLHDGLVIYGHHMELRLPFGRISFINPETGRPDDSPAGPSLIAVVYKNA